MCSASRVPRRGHQHPSHHEEVAGVPNLRPAWYFDITEQGEGIADIVTHIVDRTHGGLVPRSAARLSTRHSVWRRESLADNAEPGAIPAGDRRRRLAGFFGAMIKGDALDISAKACAVRSAR